MGRRLRRTLRITGTVVLVVVVLAVVTAGTSWMALRASLPRLDGTRTTVGIGAAIEVERDARGRVTVVASTREDLAFGLGFAHGQDRFFQMDLLRRAGAGELAALIGPSGVRLDRAAREHGLHETAIAAFDRVEPGHRARLEAYARGVNAGLGSLGARPWEYFLLRQHPRPWRASDTLHVLHAMFRDLQSPSDLIEFGRPIVRETLVDAVADAVLDPRSPWDAPIVGGVDDLPAFDVPARGPGREEAEPATGDVPASTSTRSTERGSNSFAVGGAFTADGRALLANDMHLGLSLPTIWYATRMIVRPDGGEPALDAVGVTLPGAPALIVGSNGTIAWGFTNSYGDWADHVRLEIDPADPDRYRTPDGWRSFGERVEVVEVARADPDTLRVRTTIWGPVTGRLRDTPFATRWVAHEVEGVGVELFDLAEARSLEQALDLAPRCGIPHQNLVVVDADGRLGWTIIGRVPRRVGFDGTTPVSWAEGERGWAGWLDADAVPRHVFGADGRIWTANARVTTPEGQRLLGDAGYAMGARAGVIRDALLALEEVDEADLLAVQNLTQSPLLQRWYERLRDVVRGSPDSSHRAVEPWLDDWTGGADVGSVAYRITRGWRATVSSTVYDGLLRPARDAAGGNWVRGPREEPVVWSLLRARPEWVPGGHGSWDELERAAIDSLIAEWGEPATWGTRTWGARNTTAIEHPFASLLPDFAARRLRLPPRPVAGDSYTARVSGRTFGASERLVVAPGAEERGILHLPGGNASHPLSPYRSGDYEEWVTGAGVPLLPGPARHTLVLEPRR